MPLLRSLPQGLVDKGTGTGMKNKVSRKAYYSRFKVGVIPFPDHDSEFDVQAEMWDSIRKAGYTVRGEVRALCEELGEKHIVQFDLVIYDENARAKVIIECKNNSVPGLEINPKTRQGRRYQTFQVPIIRCSSWIQIPQAMHEIHKIMKMGNP